MKIRKIIRKSKNLAHLGLSIGANTLYGFPSKKLTVIGVTGTDGKTTTANIIYKILEEAGFKAAIISTVGAIINRKKYEIGFHVTTPSPFIVQQYLKIAKKEGCTHVVIEVTSHALDQNRVAGINFDIGVLTNITREHLDYHENYDAYLNAKMKLLKKSKIAIVNSNGKWIEKIKKEIPQDKLRTYSVKGMSDDNISLQNLPFEIKTKLIGDFNLENILAAICVGLELKIPVDKIDQAIQKFEAPEGRQQIIQTHKNGKVIIDFAHTPNSFEKFLPMARKMTRGRLIHVFGCAGKRDMGKRVEMGKIASMYDNVIILTAEDPRGEEISKINEMIKSEIANKFKVGNIDQNMENNSLYEIDDRKKAIEFALKNSSEFDTVVITGKGHEKSMNLGKGEVPWNDEKVVNDFIESSEI